MKRSAVARREPEVEPPRRKVQEGTEIPSPLRLLPDVGQEITETDVAMDQALREVVESAMFSSILWTFLKKP